MLRLRLLSAIILIGSVLFMIFMDGWRPLFNAPGFWMLPVMLFFSVGTAWEFGQLASRSIAISPVVACCLTLLVVCISALPIFYTAAMQRSYPQACPIGIPGWIGLGTTCACGLAGVMTLRGYARGETQMLERWAVLTLIAVYVGGLSGFWVAIRLHGEPIRALLYLVGILTITKVTDASAYFTGRTFGKHKLCPSISPGKTMEGAIGGLLAGVIAALVYFHIFIPEIILDNPRQPPAWWGAALLGLLLGVFAIIGDLIESVVKRTAGAKDSSRLLPGLGGIWDVTDSLLPTAAIGYLGLIAHWI